MLDTRFFIIIEKIVSAAIRAPCLTVFLNGQVDLRMRIPQIHAGHRTRQRQIMHSDHILVLRVCGDQILIDGTCSICHFVHLLRCHMGRSSARHYNNDRFITAPRKNSRRTERISLCHTDLANSRSAVNPSPGTSARRRQSNETEPWGQSSTVRRGSRKIPVLLYASGPTTLF